MQILIIFKIIKLIDKSTFALRSEHADEKQRKWNEVRGEVFTVTRVIQGGQARQEDGERGGKGEF